MDLNLLKVTKPLDRFSSFNTETTSWYSVAAAGTYVKNHNFEYELNITEDLQTEAYTKQVRMVKLMRFGYGQSLKLY